MSGERMSDFLRKSILFIALVCTILLTVRLLDVFILVFGSIVFAGVLVALASPLSRRLHIPQRVALVLVVLVLVLLTVAASWLIGDAVVKQFAELRDTLPHAIAAASQWLDTSPVGGVLLDFWQELTKGATSITRLATIASMTAGGVTSAVLMLIMALYFASDPGLYQRGFVRLFPRGYRPNMERALVASAKGLYGWLLGQFIAMILIGVSTTIALWALGTPMALSLGVIAGILEFVPLFGPIAAGVLSVLVAFTESPMQALYVGILFVVIQQVESNILMPVIQRWTVALPPVLGLLAVVIFGMLFGIAGVLFATPLMVVVLILIHTLYVEDVLESDHHTTQTGH